MLRLGSTQSDKFTVSAHYKSHSIMGEELIDFDVVR